jgi:hypothetical protein
MRALCLLSTKGHRVGTDNAKIRPARTVISESLGQQIRHLTFILFSEFYESRGDGLDRP